MAKIIDFNTAATAKATQKSLGEGVEKSASRATDMAADNKNSLPEPSGSTAFKRGKILAFSAAEQTQDMIADTLADGIIAATLPDTSPEARPCALHMTLVFLITSVYAAEDYDEADPADYTLMDHTQDTPKNNLASSEKQAFIHDQLVKKLNNAIEQTLGYATDTATDDDSGAQTRLNPSPKQQETLLNSPLLCAFLGRDNLLYDPCIYPPEEPAYKTVYAGLDDIEHDSFDLWERLHEMPMTPPSARALSPYEACLQSYELCCAHVALSTRKECWEAATDEQRYFSIRLKTQELESLIAEPTPDAAARGLARDSLKQDFTPFLDRLDEHSNAQRRFAQLCKTHHMRLLRIESRTDNTTPSGPK